jgi:hypothetical protein
MWSKHQNSLTKLASLSSLNKLRRSILVKRDLYEVKNDKQLKDNDSYR